MDHKSPKQLAEEGAQLAADHADRVIPNWTAVAIMWTQRVADRGAPFITGEVRAEAERNGFPRPPDGRSWGHVIRSLVVRGTIRPTGRYRASTDPVCHHRPQTEWTKS